MVIYFLGGLVTTLSLGIAFILWVRYKKTRQRLGLYQMMPEPLACTDDKGAVIFSNPAFQKIFLNRHRRSYIQSIAEYISDPKKKSFFIHQNPDKSLGNKRQNASFLEFVVGDKKYPFFIQKHRPQKNHILWMFSSVNRSSVLSLQDLCQGLEKYPVPVVFVSDGGDILYINQAFFQWLGFSLQRLLRKNFLDIFFEAPESWKSLNKKIFYFYDSSGGLNPGSVLYSNTFVSLKISVFFIKPTDRTYPLDRLDDLSFLESLPVACAFMNDKGALVCVNDLCHQKLHLPHPVSSKENKWAPVHTWVDHDEIHVILKTIKSLSHATSATLHPIDIQGKHERLKLYIKPMPSMDKHPDKFLLILQEPSQDAQEPRNSDTQRLQILGQLASGIVHDFNNLLTGIMGFCDLLIQRHKKGDPSYKDIAQIQESASRASGLIRQLLSFSKQTTPIFKPLDVGNIIQKLSVLIQRLIGPKISLVFTNKRKNIRVLGDQGQFEQVLMNLAVNARDAMSEEGGTLSFTLEHLTVKAPTTLLKGSLIPQSYVLIKISDTGSGIPKDKIARIFDPFYSTKDPGHGTGVGLSNVLSITEQFQGAIDLETQLGKGTTFFLYFPEYQEKEGKLDTKKSPLLYPETSPLPETLNTSPKSDTSTSSSQVRVLLAEDEAPVRLFAARALKENGFDVVVAKDGLSALEFVKKDPSISLVITDVMMPGMDGPDLIKALIKMGITKKILFVSGYPEDEIRSQLFQHTQDVFFLAKPFDLKNLVGKVREIMEK